MTFNETVRWLQEHDRFLILTHRRPDGDTLGSAAGLAEGLLEMGKTAYILHNPEATARYTTYVEKHWAPEDYTPDVVVTVDTASTGLFPDNAEAYKDRVDLSIDHHPSNALYAKQLYLDGSKSSCGEIVYALLMALSGSVSEETATSLYVAVSTDTGCFQFMNTTADTLRTAAALVDAGAPIGEINRELFRKKARSRIVLEAMITSNMKFYYDGAVAVATITKAMLEKTGATENDLDDVAAIPGSIAEVIVAVTIRELSGPGDCKVSVRTTPLVNASDLSARFGGGGHAMAAGFSLKESAETIEMRLLDALAESFPGQSA